MNSKYFTALAVAAGLLIGGPAFGAGKHDVRGGGARVHAAAAHVSARRSTRAVAAVHHTRTYNRTAYARRGVSRTGSRAVAVTRSARSSRAGVAFGGSSVNARSYAGGGSSHRQFAFASHSGWSPGSEYYWHGHHYRWFGNGWFIIDSFYGGPYYGYGPDYGYDSGGYDADSASVQVQQNLLHDGYYSGPIDGIVGPQTSAAIADYQRDNGLPVTGGIDGPLLSSMGI